MMPPPHLHLRPDDRVEAGAGHLSRCLSLGIAWRRHGTVSADVDPGRTPWAERYSTAGIELGASPRPPDWLVVDDYRFGPASQRSLRAAAHRLGVIDDHGSLAPYDADLVIDQNIGAVVPSPSVAGCTYAMLRPEFVAARRQRVHPDTAATVLVSIGGSPTAATHNFAVELSAALADAGLTVDLLSGADDVAVRMASVDLAVSAAGSSAYELACVGTPSMLVAVADNQEPIGRRLADAGAAVYLGNLVDVDPTAAASATLDLAASGERRCELATRAASLVDGRGADRVVARLLEEGSC